MYENCTTNIQHTPVLKKDAVILWVMVENSKLLSYDDMYWSTSSNTISSIFNASSLLHERREFPWKLFGLCFFSKKNSLSFNLTKNSFIVENHNILENDILTKETDVETTYTVNGFRCNTTSYEAEQEPYPTLKENHVISICIRSDNDSAGTCQISR